MPAQDELPLPGARYFEIETAKLHGGWPAWESLKPAMKAELLAHEEIKNMRDHYYMDKRGRPKQNVAVDPRAAMRSRFFNQPFSQSN